MPKVGLARVISARLRGALFAVAAVLGLWSLPANAVIITVGGTAYDVVFSTNGFNTAQPSFTDNATALQATPWFGNPTLAQDFANAYDTQVTGGDRFNLSPDPDLLAFAYTTAVNMFFVFEGGGVNSSTLPAGHRFIPIAYAYTVPIITPVPEIDGSALFKALFCLFTLALWLQIRRNRRFG